MEFVAHHLLGVLARPVTDLVMATLLALLAMPRLRWLRSCCAIAWGALLLLPVQQWVALPLEDRFARPAPPAHVDGVVVLGGALRSVISAERGIPSFNAAAERMTELVALARRYPAAKIVFTGGDASLLPGGMTEADIARQFVARSGVSADRMLFEEHARDTWENAIFARALAQPVAGETWLLVTSAMHMPRATGSFRSAGWPPMVPWPVAYENSRSFVQAALASLEEKAMVLDEAAHEWAGLLVARVEGHSPSLFPGP